MFKPKLNFKDLKYCQNCHETELEPHVESLQSIKNVGKIYHIDFWFCPECGSMYYFKDLTKIINK